MSQDKLNILIIGSTGNLGCLITRECLARDNLRVNVLIRNPDKCKDLREKIESAGGRVFIGDITDPESIRDCTKGMHTVISAVIGDDRTVIEGQHNLLKDALKNNVQRFVPSDFSFDIDNMKLGEHYFTDQRLKFRQILEKSHMKALYFSTGMFLQTYFWMVSKGGFTCWGSADKKIDLTAEEDIARFVAAAVSDPDRIGKVKISGNRLSTKEIVDIYNLETGKHEEYKLLGSLEDLKLKVADFKKKGDMFNFVQYGYGIPIYDGRGDIKEPMNDQFPEVKTTKLDEFVKANLGKQQYDYSVPDIVKGAKEEILAK